jgi:nucleotide-binding universal stress UspA family protein
MKKIVVPVDFSKASETALHYAAAVAKQISASLELVHVISVDSSSAKLMNWKKLEEQMTSAATEDGQKYLDKLQGGAKATFRILSGFPFQDVVEEYVLKNRVDLVVMGSSGASGIRKVFGSNSSALINHSQVPVLVVPSGHEFKGMTEIVYATDMTRLDDEIKLVAAFARPFDARVTILHIAKEAKPARYNSNFLETIKTVAEYNSIVFSETDNENVVAGIENYLEGSSAQLLALFTHEVDLYEKVFNKSVTRNLAHQNILPLLAFNRRF